MVEPPSPDEDELEDLPALDGDSSDRPDEQPDFGGLRDVLEDASGEASLDDSTAEDDPISESDLDLDDSEGGWIGEAAEAEDLELGGVAIVDFAEGELEQEDEEGPAAVDEDFGFGAAANAEGLDPAEEGPVDADEELRDSDLPALDADDEGDVQDSALVDPSFASDEPLGLPWAARPWPRVGAPVALAGASAVACAARGALVAARSEFGVAELARIDLEGACERLVASGIAARDVRGVAVDGAVVATVLADGRLFVSTDSGGRFAPAVALTSAGVAVVDAVFVSGRLWARTRAGGLVLLGQGSEPPMERCPTTGVAAALAAAVMEGKIVAAALLVDEAQRPTAIVRAKDAASIRRESMGGPEVLVPVIFSARGMYAAYVARRGGVVLQKIGEAGRLFEWGGTVTALAFVDEAGTVVASTYSDVDDTSTLVRLDAAGNPSVVARIGAAHTDADSDGRTIAMAYDEARGVVWVAGGFGVAAFATR
jgi:hypothetical protein